MSFAPSKDLEHQQISIKYFMEAPVSRRPFARGSQLPRVPHGSAGLMATPSFSRSDGACRVVCFWMLDVSLAQQGVSS